jgi:hypothetical protein
MRSESSCACLTRSSLSRLVYQNADVRKSSAFAFSCLSEGRCAGGDLKRNDGEVFYVWKECECVD